MSTHGWIGTITFSFLDGHEIRKASCPACQLWDTEYDPEPYEIDGKSITFWVGWCNHCEDWFQ